jgi:transposase InsO family protein
MVLADKWAAQYGLNRTLAALGVSKGTWHYRRCYRQAYIEKYAALRKPLMAIARKHPHYGYRKVTDELQSQGWVINEKVVRNLQAAWELPLMRAVRRPKPSVIRRVLKQMGDRINLVATLKTIGILHVLYTDFTELLFYRRRSKAYLMPLLDHTSKFVVGWAVGSSDNSVLALEAWQRARANLKYLGVKFSGLIVHHDQDSVYTGNEWLHQIRLVDNVRVSYALNGARDNTEMESFNGHFKEENSSILWEQRDLRGVIRVVQSRIVYYNDIRRHASLGNVSPANFLRENGFNPR